MIIFEKLNRTLHKNLQQAGIFDHNGHYIMSGILSINSRVLDLGANVGSFYTLMHNKYNCTCYAVEASPQLYANLPPIKNVHAFNYAIGKFNGEAEFHLSSEPEANSLQQTIASFYGVLTTVKVRVITLEKFLQDHQIELPLDVLKIDIEGAETDVINTLPDDILKKIKQIPVEFHDFLNFSVEYKHEMNSSFSKLKKNNFQLIKISPYSHSAILCINRTMVALTQAQKIRLNLVHPVIQYLMMTHSALYNVFNGTKKNK